jgi:hypothetical protein
MIAFAHLENISKDYIRSKVPLNIGLLEHIYFSAEKVFYIQVFVDRLEIYAMSM